MRNPLAGAFRALRNFNFRLWTAGGLVSNIGTWMQRVAQDWIVLTQLTQHDATAVGIVTGLQFAPQLLLLPWSGLAADRFNQRKLLMLTQASMGVLATALGILTISGYVRLFSEIQRHIRHNSTGLSMHAVCAKVSQFFMGLLILGRRRPWNRLLLGRTIQDKGETNDLVRQRFGLSFPMAHGRFFASGGNLLGKIGHRGNNQHYEEIYLRTQRRNFD